MVLVEQQYKEIRKKLDDMGFHQPCSSESILLVSRLLNDLCNKNDKLLVLEEVSSSALMKCDQLESAMDTLAKKNQNLIKENNQLHINAIKLKDEMQKKERDLKMRINDLENMYSDLEFNCMEQIASVGALRQELIEKTNILYELGVNVEENCAKFKDYRIDQSENLLKSEKKNEIDVYKKKQQQLVNEIDLLESQLQSRNTEISRLRQQMEEQKCYVTTSGSKNQCSCHFSTDACILPQQSKSITDLHKEIQKANDKQHEAMQKAIALADQNQQLQSDLNVLEQKYLIKNKCSCGTNVTLLKKQHNETLNKIQDLEKRISNLQVLIGNLSKEKDDAVVRVNILEKEKKELNDRLVDCKMIENDLNKEIDRLRQNSADLKDEMARIVERSTKSIEMGDAPASSAKNITHDDSYDVEPCCEKLRAERDYYCNELHRLQEKVYTVERIQANNKCNHTAANGLDAKLMNKIQWEMNSAKEENKRLQNEIYSLKNQVMEFSTFKRNSNEFLENHLKNLESDKGNLATINSNLKNRLYKAEQTCRLLNTKVDTMTEELNNYKMKYNHLKKMNMHLDMSLKHSQTVTKQVERDLAQSMARLREMEKELNSAREEIKVVRKEKQVARENLLRLDNEKDELLLKLDDKTELISKLDRDLLAKSAKITELDNKKSKLQTQIHSLEKMLHHAQEKCKESDKDVRKMEHELSSLQTYKENLLLENRTLKEELAAVSQDMILNNEALEKYRKESYDLKRELQTYVDEVRRVEKILLEKEREREALLEQFNALSAEASHLESNHQSLECEASHTKDNLRDAKDKLSTLQKDARAKDSLVSLLQDQVQDLSGQLIQLQSKMSEMGERELILTTDLHTSRNLCSTLEDQKQYYNSQLSQITSNEQALRDELDRLECENQILQNQLGHERKNSNTMETLLTTSRQEAIEKSIYNEDIVKEMKKMKDTITSLEVQLASIRSALSDCQSTCADYHSQNVQLKRQLTNEKFEKVKGLDSTSNSTSL